MPNHVKKSLLVPTLDLKAQVRVYRAAHCSDCHDDRRAIEAEDTGHGHVLPLQRVRCVEDAVNVVHGALLLLANHVTVCLVPGKVKR